MAVSEVIVLIPLFFGAFCIVGSATLGKDHQALRIFLFMLSFISVFVAMNFASVALAGSGSDITELQELMAWTTRWMSIFFMLMVFYIFLYMVYKFYGIIQEKKNEKIEYD